MTPKARLLSTVVAGLLVASPMSVLAAQSGSGATNGQTSGQDASAAANAFDQISQDGLAAFRSVSLARAAINDGHYDAAKDLLGKAQKDLQAAAKDRNKGSGKAAGGQDMIPILGQYQITEVVETSPEQSSHLNKAKEHLKKGNTGAAMHELDLSGSDLSLQMLALPLSATQDHVNAALDLLSQKKYHEANMALKAVEDSVQYNAVSVIVPVGQQQQQQQTTGDKSKN